MHLVLGGMDMSNQVPLLAGKSAGCESMTLQPVRFVKEIVVGTVPTSFFQKPVPGCLAASSST